MAFVRCTTKGRPPVTRTLLCSGDFSPRRSGQVKRTGLDQGGEGLPVLGRDGQRGTVRVLGVAYQQAGHQGCRFYAVAAVAAAVGRLAPAGACHVHSSTLLM